MATFMNKEEELQSRVETLEHRIERLERAMKNMSEQDSNCNLPHVINAVCSIERNHETCSMHKVSRYGCSECMYNKQTDL